MSPADVLLAFVFNVLYGRITFWRRQSSAPGMDSLSDVISFGVAPVVIACACGMQGLFDHILLLYFDACDVSRLARFSVTAEKLSEGDMYEVLCHKLKSWKIVNLEIF